MTCVDQWKPSGLGEKFVLVMPNGSEILQVVNHFEDPDHWEAGEPPFSEAARTDVTDLPRRRIEFKCNCPSRGIEGVEHFVTCPVYEPPLTYDEIRALRAIILAPEPKS